MTQIYLVGGAVRDKLLGISSKDLDYVITGLQGYEELKSFVISLGCDIKVETPEYGVIRAVHSKLGGLDFALPRVDYNQDGRHSEVRYVETIEEDLERRDFTINAMALKVNDKLESLEEIIDPLNGKKDLEQKMLKFVGDPALRIEEDSLRVLRGLRFFLTKDLTSVDGWTHSSLLRANIGEKVSNERIMDELNKMFICGNARTVNLLSKYNKLQILNRIKIRITT